jgi:hypothetical protein
MKKYLGYGMVVTLVAAATYFAAAGVRQRNGFNGTVQMIQRTNGQDERRVVRTYRPTGEWMEVSTDIKTGSQRFIYGTSDLGVIESNHSKKENEFIGGWGPPISAERIRKDPAFADESAILGYKVLRIHLDEANGSKTDLYRAPDLHGMLLKVSTVTADGSTMTLEPESIEIGHRDFVVPNYPVTRDLYNLRHTKR